ncbi:MAG: DUF3823 domain-containing protein [Bacteroidales bacterium]|nr:DUF3823 domain-containing protein [Bacteroidales bacterium]
MKKVLYFLPVLLMVTACDWFVFDNVEGYDATITGTFKDATGNPVLFGVPDNYGFTIYEENFTPSKGKFVSSAQTWYAKTNGTYTNKMVFAGDYKIDTKTNNFYPITESFTIAKGDNTHDFMVTPYARIKNVQISYDAATKELVAKCTVEHGDVTKTNGIQVFFMIAQDRFVAKNNNNAKDATASSPFIEGGDVELRIKTTGGNNSEFKYTQPHYVRIAAQAAHCAIVPAYDEETVDWAAWGAMGYAGYPNVPDEVKVIVHHDAAYTNDGSVNPNQAYNYSSVYRVSEDFSTITEVTDWD